MDKNIFNRNRLFTETSKLSRSIFQRVDRYIKEWKREYERQKRQKYVIFNLTKSSGIKVTKRFYLNKIFL